MDLPDWPRSGTTVQPGLRARTASAGYFLILYDSSLQVLRHELRDIDLGSADSLTNAGLQPEIQMRSHEVPLSPMLHLPAEISALSRCHSYLVSVDNVGRGIFGGVRMLQHASQCRLCAIADAATIQVVQQEASSSRMFGRMPRTYMILRTVSTRGGSSVHIVGATRFSAPSRACRQPQSGTAPVAPPQTASTCTLATTARNNST